MKNLIIIVIFLAFFSGLGLVISNYLIKNPTDTNVAGVVQTQTVKGASASPEQAVQAVKIVNSIPKTLQIPKIKVNANVESVGMNSKGGMDVPKLDADVAWYNLGGKIGQSGNAVMAGHLDNKNGGPAVFWDLDKLNPGDEITIKGQDGNKYIYKVTDKEVYQDAAFPLQEVFGDTTKKRLNLITCEGTYDKSAKNYSDRLVVYSELVE